MKKGNLNSDACACGEPQTMEHLMNCSQAPRCTENDLVESTAAAVACAAYWKDSIQQTDGHKEELAMRLY